MRRFFVVLLLLLPTTSALAETKLLEGDDLAIKRCLDAWGTKQPFKVDPLPKYNVLEANVKVLGVGDDLVDNDATSGPALTLVKPSVSVLSKHTLRLLNPNGWYCLKADVTVLAKTVLELGCYTRVADAQKGVAVLGSNEEGTGHGVTVLGVTEVKRIGCDKATH